MGVLFDNSGKSGRMSVRSRSDMVIKTNMIWFPRWGLELILNPSRCCLCSITQEHKVPQKAQGLGLYESKPSNLIYKIKSGNVLLPGSTFVYQSRVTFILCSSDSVLQQLALLISQREGRSEGKGEKDRKGQMWEHAVRRSELTTHTIDIFWP